MSTIYVDNLSPNLGSRVMAAGHVVQVVKGTSTSSVAISSTTETSTGLSATITPTSSSSLVLVTVTLGEFRSYTDSATRFQIYRGGSKIIDLFNEAGYGPSVGSGMIGFTLCGQYVDSPSSTSSTSYTLYGRMLQTNTGVLQIMPNSLSISTMTLMEIAQ